MLETGAMVGVYRVERFLGAGGMGSVYEVTHTAMHTRHAMKVLADQYLRSPGVRERFRREAELMYSLRANPHIVGATDVIDTPNQVALVLDLVDGGDLGEALDRRPGGLPWAEAWRVLGPIISAVAFAHERNVVHRDLKPGNVLLRREGPWPGVPLVADFGIAKVIGSESATRTQARMGTACYGAPEQFKNAKEVGAQADVWSLGMLAWRLITGTLPVDPEDNVALIKLYEGLIPVPRLEGVPEHVAVAVAAALQTDPTQRPLNAAALQKLLTAEAALEQPPVSAPREVLTSPAETGRPPESGRKRLWLGLGVGAALSAAIVGLAVGGRGSPAAPDPVVRPSANVAPEPPSTKAPSFASVESEPSSRRAPDQSALLDPFRATATAPPTFKVKFHTTNGAFVVEAYRDWAPLGVDRFYNLVKIGYFNDVAFFRAIEGFMVQFGIHGDPKVSAAWRDASIGDDAVRNSNLRGHLTFATRGPDTRTTQLFINFVDNANLDTMGFAAFAKVVDGMGVVDSLYKGYGEGFPSGSGPKQDRIQNEGNAYLKAEFPRLDYIQSAELLP
jgi:peptidyl-prolyl cis-trans isomerase A (cyclophilin A)